MNDRIFLNGMPLIESSAALEQTNEPARTLPVKRWHAGRCYHRRVQKKWVKRYGWEQKAAIWKTPHGIYVHPSLMPVIRRAVAKGDLA